MNLFSLIWSLVGEFLTGLVCGLLGGSFGDILKHLSKMGKHL